jgi:hypothetical protein
MRSILTVGLLAVITALAPLPGGTAVAADHPGAGRPTGTPGATSAPSLPEQASPRAVLATAQRVLSGDAQPLDPSTTIALRDLLVAMPSLRGDDARQAEAILARPSDGGADPYGDGYTVDSRKTCGSDVCVHWVPRTGDAPPSRTWVDRNKEELNRVHRRLSGALGYREPLPDGRRGGNPKLDVYLKDIGSDGLYGYCAPERRHRTAPRTASGFCVLDDDFAEFSGTRTGNMQVTAAHELFHAVQYAYDYREDAWFMESTSTWVEERLADAVDDNRAYLSAGQLRRPRTPLDLFSSGGTNQYGNWIWWEHLSQRLGRSVVRQVWNRAGAFAGAPNQYSVQALGARLRSSGGLTAAYTRFASDNLAPGSSYAEGSGYPSPRVPSRSIGRDTRQGEWSPRLAHLTSTSLRLTPGADLRTRRWRLRLVVDAPARRTGPGARVLVTRTDGDVERRRVRLDGSGDGRLVVPFGRTSVRSVAVTVANASTRYRCNRGTSYACAGQSRDDGRRYAVRYTLRRR